MKWWNKIIEHFNRGYEEEDLELEWESSSVEDWDWENLVKDRNLLKIAAFLSMKRKRPEVMYWCRKGIMERPEESMLSCYKYFRRI